MCGRRVDCRCGGGTKEGGGAQKLEKRQGQTYQSRLSLVDDCLVVERLVIPFYSTDVDEVYDIAQIDD